jgi:hypothetical protein
MSTQSSQPISLDFKFTPKQALAFQSTANEIFWGGAAGGGKSIFLRFLSIVLCSHIPNLQVYLFRRTRPDLIKSHVEGPKGYRALLAGYIKSGLVTLVEDECRFNFNGSKIYFCHCKDEEDKNNFLSTEMHVLLIDELTTFTESIYTFLRSRVRATGLNVPEQYKNTIPRILCTSNPGNVGHQWVKQTFVDNCLPLELRQMDPEQGGMLRQFIPAKITDNPFLLSEDPNYINRLKGMGSPAQVKAYLDGDWNIVKGQFFPEFGTQHQIEPFSIPSHWTKYRALDWGSRSPFYVGWYTINTESFLARDIDGNSVAIEAGSMIQYREWNGEKAYNVGLNLTLEAVADGIIERDCEDRIDYSIADSSMFDEDGGPSQIEIMQTHTDYKLIFFKADKRRIPGHTAVRSRLVGLDNKPALYFFKTCYGIIRDLPQIQHSEKKMEDSESEGVADHSYDTLRYAVQSRPYTSEAPPKKIDSPKGLKGLTLEKLYELNKKRTKNKR